MQTQQQILEEFILGKLRSEKLSLITINNGEIIETFDEALKRVFENCADINTTLEKREITIKVTFNPSSDRTYIPHKAAVTYKLAGMAPIEGASDLAIDGAGAGPYAKRRREPQDVEMFSNVTSMERSKK